MFKKVTITIGVLIFLVYFLKVFEVISLNDKSQSVLRILLALWFAIIININHTQNK